MVSKHRHHLLPTCQDRSSARRSTEAQPAIDDLPHRNCNIIHCNSISHTMPGFLGKKFPAPVGTSIGPLLGPARAPEGWSANDAQLSPCGPSTSPVRRARNKSRRILEGRASELREMRLMRLGARGRLKEQDPGLTEHRSRHPLRCKRCRQHHDDQLVHPTIRPRASVPSRHAY